MNNKFFFIFILIVAGLLAGAGLYFRESLIGIFEMTPDIQISSFEDCAAAGYPVLESYPRQCHTVDNQVFIEYIGNELEKRDLIQVGSLRPNEIIQSPLTILGEARGFWFFKAGFPVRLLDSDGKEIAAISAQANGNWMTEEFVPFQATLVFSTAEGKRGTLIFEKDNPSGLSEHADELRMPVIFGEDTGKSSTGSSVGACVITGCSSQICAEEEMISTCEYRAEYICYESATCKRQADGQCGWTPSVELAQCVDEAQNSNTTVFLKSGVQGVVSFGPQCPVVREGKECPDKPYKTIIDIYISGGAKISSISSKEDGIFSTLLEAGIYTLRPRGGNPFPVCESVDVEILQDGMVFADIVCDTGIR